MIRDIVNGILVNVWFVWGFITIIGIKLDNRELKQLEQKRKSIEHFKKWLKEKQNESNTNER